MNPTGPAWADAKGRVAGSLWCQALLQTSARKCFLDHQASGEKRVGPGLQPQLGPCGPEADPSALEASTSSSVKQR